MKELFTVRKNITANGKPRLKIKGFKSSDALHKFINKQNNNDWVETRPNISKLKPGIYALIGTDYHNIKNISPSVLAHI